MRGGLLTAHGLQFGKAFLVVTAKERLHNGAVFRPKSGSTHREQVPTEDDKTKRTITRVIGKSTQSRIWGSRYNESLSIVCANSKVGVQWAAA